MERVNHYLKSTENSYSVNNILIVDTETNIENLNGEEIQTFRLGYAIHIYKQNNGWTKTHYEINSINDFWSLLDKIKWDKTKLWIFAHNMAFDYTILKIDSYLASRNLEIKLRVVESSLFIVKADNLIFLSSTNYYHESLKELGEIFELSKMKSPDFKSCTDEELKPYNKRDTEVLEKIISKHIEFIKNNDLGCLQITIAGQAFAAYRHRFMQHELLVHTYKDILDLEQESYRGGRSEAFKLGKFKEIYKLDVNSMYPFVMRENIYPIKPVFSTLLKNVNINMLQKAILNNKFILAECNIKLYEPIIGCKRNKKLIFPIGNIKQAITNPEIKYILENPNSGTIISINKYIEYDAANIFKTYVDFFYKIKTESKNNAIKTMAKLFLNSCYGKFGQRTGSTQTLITDINLIKEITSYMKFSNTLEHREPGHKYLNLGGFIYDIGKRTTLSKNSIPIIASAVTSYSRILLYNLINIANKNNVLYCDTDSLFVNKKGYNNLKKSNKIDTKKLGKLKLEEIGNCQIFGAKDYIFNKTIKLKGIKHDAEKLNDGSYKQYQFQTKNTKYARGTPDGIVIVAPIIKHLSREYNKGIVDKDGVIHPYYLNEW